MASFFLFPEGNGDGEDLWSGSGFCPQSPLLEKLPPFLLTDDLQCSQDVMVIGDTSFSMFTPAFESPSSKPIQLESSEEEPTRLVVRNDCNTNDELGLDRRELSTEEVMRVAAAQYIQLSSLVVGDPSEIKLPFGLSPSDLTLREARNVALANTLMTAAEMVASQEYGIAKGALEQCKGLSSCSGDTVQRVVHYFSEALQERVKTKTGSGLSRGPEEMGASTHEDVKRAGLLYAHHQVQKIPINQLPFPQVTHFTAIQTILDNMTSSKTIHIVDLSMKHGHQWTVLMHALASRTACPIASLKITLVGEAEENVAAPGESLSSFAKGLSLPFRFRTVVVPEMEGLREDMFELEEGETVAMFSSLGFNNLIVAPKSLENLMRVICRIRPSILMVLDVEAMLNSQSFLARFSGALFFYSAYFDCIGSVMEGFDDGREMVERSFFSKAIKSVLAAEGSGRVVRRVGVRVWKAYFRRFGVVEADLGAWSMYQASLMLKRFVRGDSCTLEKRGKALLVGWKGTPLHFVSCWKFQNKKKDDHTNAGAVPLGAISRFEDAHRIRCLPIEDEPILS